MEQGLFWGIVVFAALRLTALFIARIFCYPIRPDAARLVMVTENSQGSVEWVIRSFFFWKFLSGQPCQVTCLDTGSFDDTCRILFRLQKSYPALTACDDCRNLSEDELREKIDRVVQNGNSSAAVIDLRHHTWSVAAMNHIRKSTLL
ncbi:hypothetical protein [Paludifilum halophilum]|uniref:Uncharacterized protein n=1 Tax=Paludifilum halophilum TaxID=1642702 RepID=A0A235B8Y9_9BACL|nr:hypothetical protein [Paludifilum halophilum]OYD08055.1 hypothetical protein CHM34_08045 [Paludifilum halophilum]